MRAMVSLRRCGDAQKARLNRVGRNRFQLTVARLQNHLAPIHRGPAADARRSFYSAVQLEIRRSRGGFNNTPIKDGGITPYLQVV